MIRSLSILAIGFELAAGTVRATEPVAAAALEEPARPHRTSHGTVLGSVFRGHVHRNRGAAEARRRWQGIDQKAQRLRLSGPAAALGRRSDGSGVAPVAGETGQGVRSPVALHQRVFHVGADLSSAFPRELSFFRTRAPTPIRRRSHRVHFEHVHGKPTPSVLQLRSRDYPIEWQGTAWIDSATGNIARIQAALRSSLADIGLQKLESDVRYGAVSFAGHRRSALDAANRQHRSRYRAPALAQSPHFHAL